MKTSEAFPSKWMAAGDVEPKLDVTIRGLTQEEVGRDKEIKAVLWFEEHEKGLILNKTNWVNLCKLCDSDDSDHWHGKRVQLYSTLVQFGGEEVSAVRVRPLYGASATPTKGTTTDLSIQGKILKRQDADNGKVGVLIQASNGFECWAGTTNTTIIKLIEVAGKDAATFKVKQQADGKYQLCAILPAANPDAPEKDTIDTTNNTGDDALPF